MLGIRYFFALGRSENGTFYIRYVGRSGDDVATTLGEHVGDYQHFKFAYFSSPSTAFEKECQLFHDFSPPGNRLHPDRPKGTTWSCPRCRMFARVA